MSHTGRNLNKNGGSKPKWLNITKTFLFPVPTEWMGQDQDDDNVGIATYNGPDRIRVWYYLDGEGNKTSRLLEAISGDRQMFQILHLMLMK